MKYAWVLSVLLLLLSACQNSTTGDKAVITEEVLEMAHRWNEAWNGDININEMMALHHNDLVYYWRGKPISFTHFEEVLKKYIIGIESYNNQIFNPVVNIINSNTAVVGFQLAESSAEAEDSENAFSLVVTRVDSEWKIIHIHEG